MEGTCIAFLNLWARSKYPPLDWLEEFLEDVLLGIERMRYIGYPCGVVL